MWEVQSWAYKRFQDEQNSAQRWALAAGFNTRNAQNSMMALESQLRAAGRNIDIYA